MHLDTHNGNANTIASLTKLWRGLATVFWTLFCLVVAIFGTVVLTLLLHTCLHVCPFSFSIVHRDEERPMMYGYVIPGCINPAWRGKVALGGCMVLPTSALCPHCGFPMRFCDPTAPDSMPDLNVCSMFATNLNIQAKTSLRARADKIRSIKLDGEEEAVIAAAIGTSDLWLATRYQGLHRMNLRTGTWTTNQDAQPWSCLVTSIAITGDTVTVEYCPFGAATYFQTATTHDNGRTWYLASGSLPLIP